MSGRKSSRHNGCGISHEDLVTRGECQTRLTPTGVGGNGGGSQGAPPCGKKRKFEVWREVSNIHGQPELWIQNINVLSKPSVLTFSQKTSHKKHSIFSLLCYISVPFSGFPLDYEITSFWFLKSSRFLIFMHETTASCLKWDLHSNIHI